MGFNTDGFFSNLSGLLPKEISVTNMKKFGLQVRRHNIVNYNLQIPKNEF